MVVNKRTRLFLSTFIVIASCSCALIWVSSSGAGAHFNQIIGVIGLIIIGWCIVSSRIMYGKFFSLILMFELSFYTLTAGQSVLCALGIPLNSTLDLYRFDSAVTVNNAYIYTFFCIILFHLGTMTKLFGKKHSFENDDWKRNLKATNRPDYSNAIRTIGWIVVVVSIVPYVYQEIMLLNSFQTFGYKESFSLISGSTSWSKILSVIGEYFVFGLFMLLAGYKDSEFRFFPAVLIVIISFTNFAVGNRSEPICYIVALLWFFKTYAKSRTGRKITSLIMIIGSCLLVLVIPIIGQTRNNGTLGLESISSAIYGKESVLNAIKETFITLGWSGYPLVKTMRLIPKDFPFHYGQSYFFALLSIVPNILGGTHISVQYAGLPEWLKKTMGLSFGPGFSMPAEAYYNFGWFGILLMVLFGRIVSLLLSEIEDREDALESFCKMGLFVVLFSIPRREMMTAIRNGVYFVGILYLCVILLYRYQKKYR